MEGKRLSDRYEILSELGRGGMGVVYRARDHVLGRDVAVKLIPPSLLTPESEQRFRTEAQLVAQMDHPSIVSIYDFGRHEGSMFFVMPVAEGHSLRQVLRDGTLSLGHAIDVGVQMAEALDYSHERNIIHRDIKPENVMVARSDTIGVRVRVMDFGLARDTNVNRLTRTGTLIGTMSYVSPEQIAGKTLDGRADIYALGTVLYECVTSDVPFGGELQSVLYRIVHERPQSPRERGADIDEELDRIIMSCLAKQPQERPQKAGEVARALRSCRAGLRDSQRVLKTLATRSIALPRRAASPFVGRKEELAVLQQHLNRAVDGKCQLAMVSGEAGTGKTRLLEELEDLARARQIRVLHGRFVEKEAAFPYYGFCEAIQDYFQQRDSGSLSSGLPDLSDIAAELIALFPMLSEIEPIRTAAGDSAAATRFDKVPAENRTQIYELLARMLTRLAAGKPLLLFFEDLHGADASVEALQYVLRRLGPTPTLVVGTYRPSEIEKGHPLNKALAAFRGDRQFAAISMGPFPPPEHREFVATLVGGTEVSGSLAKQLFEASEGNPFFTKELVRSLQDSGSIIRDGTGAWALSGATQISSDALPATIQQAVEERIGRLPEDLRAVLATASVMGRTFDARDLETLCGDDAKSDEAIDRLVQEGLVEEVRQSRGDRLAFTSGVVRDVLYGELSRRHRRSLHRKYAELLEKRNAGRLDGVHALLVHHFSEGDMPEKTVQYALMHARKALETFSPDDALRSTKTALAFLDAEWEGDRAVEGELRAQQAAALRMAGNTGRAIEQYDAAAAIFERQGQLPRGIALKLAAAETAWEARRTDETKRRVEAGIESARSAGQDESLREFLQLAATVANLGGDYARGSAYLEEAERLAAAGVTVPAEEIPRGGRLVVAMINPVAATEPKSCELIEEYEILANVFEPLVTADEQGNLVPCLCERWESVDGGASFRFKLRGDVVFHDGHPLTAAAVKRSLERAAHAAGSNLAPGITAIRGARKLIDGAADELEGVVVRSEHELQVDLTGPLPIYPALLTDQRTAIARIAEEKSGQPSGTGPFRLTSHDERRFVLEAHAEHWSGRPASLEAIEFRVGLTPAKVVEGLRSGELDLGRDLLPGDLEQILREPRFRAGLVEVVGGFVYFVLFNTRNGPLGKNPALRRALAGVVRPSDLVGRSLGRFAEPAACFISPGILGHDAGRRHGRALSVGEARAVLREAGLGESLTLCAAVHPLIRERYGSLLGALLANWAELGIEVEVATPDMRTFRAAKATNDGIDLYIARFAPGYHDPDALTRGLFHSADGEYRAYYASRETDELLESARSESRPQARERLYRDFENLLRESDALIPLFHDVDYRVAGPRVRGARLAGQAPYVNYAELGKAETAATAESRATEKKGILQVPMTVGIDTLDPALLQTVEQGEVLPSIYETLTRDVGGARIVPWLASSLRVEEGGLKYRFRLREGVQFHDGRRLTSRDVRHSFERMLRSDNPSLGLFSMIAGAKPLIEGRATELAGIRIESAREFTIDLERPVSFFPGLLTNPVASVVPEGTGPIGRSREEGAIGTGPFRVAAFEPDRRLELEHNPYYWREGYPRSKGLVFSFGVKREEILAGFRSGRYPLAGNLAPEDVEALRSEPDFAAGLRESPRLSTYFAVFNKNRGPLEDEALRRRLVRQIDVAAIVGRTLGQLAVPAHGLIPPGLLGHEASSASPTRVATADGSKPASGDLDLSAAVNPVLTGEYAAFTTALFEAFRSAGVRIRPMTKTVAEWVEAVKTASVDVALGRWTADFPEAANFAEIPHTREGMLGKLCGTPEVDRLIEKARGETDPQSRHAIYLEIEESIRRQALLMPLFHEKVYRFGRPELEGLTVSYGTPTVAYEELKLRGA